MDKIDLINNKDSPNKEDPSIQQPDENRQPTPPRLDVKRPEKLSVSKVISGN